MPSLSRRRLRLWAAGLFAVGLVQIHNAAASKFYDLSEFWTAGSLAGTRALGNHAQYVRWQSTHGVERGTFPYPPGFAFLYVPFAHVPLAVAYGLQVALMLALAACAALLLGRIYRVPPELALLATYAWAPLTASVLLGQNSIVALLLCCAFIEGLQRDDDRIAGLAAGFLLYKPPYAAPFI